MGIRRWASDFESWDWMPALEHSERLAPEEVDALCAYLDSGSEEEGHAFLSVLEAGRIWLLRDMLMLYSRDRHGSSMPYEAGEDDDLSDVEMADYTIIVARLLSDRDRESAKAYLIRQGADCGSLAELDGDERDAGLRWLQIRHAVEALGALQPKRPTTVTMVGDEPYEVFVRRFADPGLETLLMEHTQAASMAKAHGTTDPARLREMLDVHSSVNDGAL